MSAQKIKNFFYYAIIFQTVILVIVLISFLFADFAMRKYFINDVKYEIAKIQQTRREETIAHFQDRIKQLLRNINGCVVNQIMLDHRLGSIKTKKEFEKLVSEKIQKCQMFAKPFKHIRLYVYSKISKRVLSIEPYILSKLQSDTIHYKSNLSDNEIEFINRIIDDIEHERRSSRVLKINSRRYIYEWDIIPVENRGFEFYIPQFFSEPAKSMQFITIASVPFDDMLQKSKVSDHIQYLQNKVKKFEIIVWIMRVLAFIYFISQTTMILMEIRLRTILLEDFGMPRMINDSTKSQ